jgi:AcrR family transcriptional regulator
LAEASESVVKLRRGAAAAEPARPKDEGSPPRRRTQAERTALSERRMFEAAVKLIGERGVQRTTLKDVCEAAGYSRGLANYRFGSKDAFLREVIGQFNLAWEHHIKTTIGDKTGLPAVLAAVDALESFLTDHANEMRGMYMIWYGSIGDNLEVQERLAENHRAYRRDMRRWVSEGIADGSVRKSVNADQFSIQYCSFVFGTVYQWVVNPSAFDLHSVFDYYRSVVRQLLDRE